MSFRGTLTFCLGAIFFLFLIPARSSAQYLTPKEKKDRAIAAELDIQSQELVTLEKEAAHALSLNNPSFFDHVCADAYVGTAATGEVRSKAQLVASIQQSNIKYSTFLVTNIQVRIFGPTAVVTANWTTRGAQDGRNFARQYRVLHVYYNQNSVSGWKLIAAQETMLPG
ncbi:MAG TPA: nuclear transport factor 2 family protein [Candidatus Eisenbacteria bacterium]|nr:nuclear transport factor 2 family protein [Candidatus Eisenbacteria bacterium]